ISRRKPQLMNPSFALPDHGFKLQNLWTSTIDRRRSRAGWIGNACLRNARNVSESVRRCCGTVISPECRQLRDGAAVPCKGPALQSGEISASILVVAVGLRSLGLPRDHSGLVRAESATVRTS